MQTETLDAARIYKNKMIEMNAAREKKTEANKKIISDVELQIVNSLKAARTKLSGVNPFKQA